MANKLKVQEQEAINNLAALGWGIRKIARQLGLSRNTVREYVRALPRAPGAGSDSKSPTLSTAGSVGQTDPLSTAGSVQTDPLSTAGKTGRKSLCSTFSSLIQTKVEAGLSAQRVYQDLKTEVHFVGSYESVKRFVRTLRKVDPQRVWRIEVQPGEEAQVDFGKGAVLIGADGRKTKTWIFRIVLSYSRKAYSEAVLRQNTETFIRCLENAFRYFGGVPQTLNLDNLKAAVIRCDWADPELNPKLKDFARHYGVAILPCLPGVPEHKGKCENSVKYVKGNALKARSFSALSQENGLLMDWEKTVADLRIHGTTKRQVAQLFALEQPQLKALPDSLFPSFQEGRRTVHRDGYVEVAKAYYAVPPEYVRREVWVRFDGREVRIFNLEMKSIQVHRRLEPGQFTHVLGIGGGQGSLQANLQYWLGRASGLGTFCAQWAEAVVENRGIEGMRSLMGLVRLVDKHSFKAVNGACQRALAKGSWRLRDVRALLQSTETQCPLPFDEHHPLIRNLSEYGLFIQHKTQNL